MKEKPLWRRYRRFWGADPAADIEDELSFHLEMRTRALMARGLSASEASAQATRAFGDRTLIRKELAEMSAQHQKRQNRMIYIEELITDLRLGIRALRKRPGFALVVLITLALGIGANTAIFSVIHPLLLRPLPFAEPDQLLHVHTVYSSLGIQHGSLSEPEYYDLRTRTRSLANAGVFTNTAQTLTSSGEPERLTSLRMSASMFETLGVDAARGRVFTEREDRAGSDQVVVLSHALWQRRFGGERSVVGRSLVLNGDPRVVVGIMPETFFFGHVDLYLPLALNPDSLAGRGAHYLQAVARLRDGYTAEQSRAELAALTGALKREFTRNYPDGLGFSLSTRPLHEAYVGSTRPALKLLASAVALVLLIACANVANLLFAQGEARRRELATRAALGARRSRLLRQLLAESVLLAVIGGALGVGIAALGVKLLLAANPRALPNIHPIGVNAAVLAVTFVITTLTALVFGLLPALRATRFDLHTALKEDARAATATRSRNRVRHALVACEVALAMTVLVGAGLLLRSFARLLNVDPGFRAQGVLTLDLRLPQRDYPDSLQANAFYRTLSERLGALPGVLAVGAVGNLPLRAGINNSDIEIEGRPLVAGEAAPSPTDQIVTPGFFQAFGLPLRAGRYLLASDDESAPPVVVINQAMAARFWPGQNPISTRIRFTSADTTARPPWMTIIGIVGDMRLEGLHTQPQPQLYYPHAQAWTILQYSPRAMTVLVRTARDPLGSAAAVRSAVASLDRNLAIANLETMEQVVRNAIAPRRFTTLLLAVFATVALLIAIAGVYGVIALVVAHRRAELAVRMALGAPRARIHRMVVGQGLTLALAGVILGGAGAVALTRLMGTLLFEVSTLDLPTYLGAALVLIGASLTASLIPAVRAARLDPMKVLRSEN